MVLCILLAYAVVWAVAKHQEVGCKLNILLTLRAKAIRVKLLWVVIALRQASTTTAVRACRFMGATV